MNERMNAWLNECMDEWCARTHRHTQTRTQTVNICAGCFSLSARKSWKLKNHELHVIYFYYYYTNAINARMHVCVNSWMYVFIYACMHECMYAYMHEFMYAWIHVYVKVHGWWCLHEGTWVVTVIDAEGIHIMIQCAMCIQDGWDTRSPHGCGHFGGIQLWIILVTLLITTRTLCCTSCWGKTVLDDGQSCSS